MGLSEREQQLLDDMERRLYQSEADVVQTSVANKRLNLRSVVLGIIVVIIGLVLLVAAVGAQQWWLGMLGFVAMLSGVMLGLSKRDEVEPVNEQTPTSSAKGRVSFSERLNRRWDERMEGER